MEKILPQFQMITDFDEYDKLEHEQTRFQAIIFHKQDLFKQTEANQTDKYEILPTRSLKPKFDHFQTTFSATITQKHVFTFKKIIEKYLEKSLSNFKKLQITSLSTQIFESDQMHNFGQQKLNDIIIKDNRLFNQKQKKQFLTDLFYEQKLSEFLTDICKTCHPQLSLDLIYIANLFWQAYIPHQQISLKQEDIKKLVDELIDSDNAQNYLQKVEYLNLKKSLLESDLSDFQIKCNLKDFIRKYGVTLILVMEEYFNNPYFKEEQEQNNNKRLISFRDISNDQFSDDQDQINFYGKKKRQF